MLDADPAAWRWVAVLSLFTADLAGGVVADLLLRDPVKRTAALLLRLGGVRSRMFRSDKRCAYLPQPGKARQSREPVTQFDHPGAA